MNAKQVVLAAAAAALFTAGTSTAAQAGESGEVVHCKGVNACKGQTDCANPGHDCSGKNSCKGKGWKSMSAEECEKAKAEMGA
jgi:hypothetical protein